MLSHVNVGSWGCPYQIISHTNFIDFRSGGMDDHNIRIEFDLRPEKEAKLVAALETTVLICFASIAKNLNFVTKAMVRQEAVVQRIEGSVINVVLKMNEFWSGEDEINK